MSNNTTLRAPAGVSGQVQTAYGNYAIGTDGSVTVDSRVAAALINAGYTLFSGKTGESVFLAPAAADLVSVSNAAALSVNGARTLATQPDYPRKLQVRLVRSAGDVTAGILTIIGVTAQGATVSEVVSLITAGASLTLKTANAYASVTSATVSALALSGGASWTLGVGRAADLGLSLPPNFVDLNVFAETVASSALDVWTVASEAVGTVDTVAGTVAPTTAADAAHHFTLRYGFSQ